MKLTKTLLQKQIKNDIGCSCNAGRYDSKLPSMCKAMPLVHCTVSTPSSYIEHRLCFLLRLFYRALFAEMLQLYTFLTYRVAINSLCDWF